MQCGKNGGATLMAVVLGLVAGCSGRTGGPGTSGMGAGGLPPILTSVGDDGGSAAAPGAPGETVAVIETLLPDTQTFILRGNVPVPPRTFPRADGLQPFTIRGYDGSSVETQTEVVTRYADWNQGAEVVEVIARVRRDPGLGRGAFGRYEVVQAPRPGLPGIPGSPGSSGSNGATLVQKLLDPLDLSPDLHALLADPRAIEIATYDCFGNKYVCYPLDGSGTQTLLSHGAVETKLRVYQVMTPVVPVSGPRGTLPHFFGVHAYLTTQSGEELVGIDLRFNNGHSGSDTSTLLDDPLGKVYFERIDVSLPHDWFLDQAFEDPVFGEETVVFGKEIAAPARRTVSLVNPLPGVELHVMGWQGQLHRRLMLSTAASREIGCDYLERGMGQGFVVRDFDPGTSVEYFSWWNRGTARYFPQSYQLPLLDHVGRLAIRAQEQREFDELRSYLVLGTNTGANYPVSSSNLGWAHPWGVPYGGMTGGNEIFIFDGVATAYAASRLGTQRYKALHRMHTDRHPLALYDVEGRPSSVEVWTRNSEKGAYVPFQHFNGPNLSTGDPFGVLAADPFQVNHVRDSVRAPSYERALLDFDPHDLQHYIRYTRAPKVLVWLTNDALAKDDISMQAENFHLSYHTLNNAAGGGYQGTGMKSDQLFVREHPGKSFHFGRGEAWGFDCATAAYAFADESWRDRKRPWFEDMLVMLSRGQGSCNGFIQGIIQAKNLGGRFRTRQQIEQSITESMLQSVRETVFRGWDPAHADLCRDVLRASLAGFISDMNFRPGSDAPRSQTAVGPLDLGAPVYCTLSQIPAGGFSQFREAYQDWSSFAWGHEITGSSLFMQRALGQFGTEAANLLMELEQDGLRNLENRAAILALTQRLAGEL